MKAYYYWTIFFVFAIVLSSCSGKADQKLSEDLIATEVSLILTETALSAEVEVSPTVAPTFTPLPTQEATPTFIPTPTETPTATPDLNDPSQRLGSPAMTYDFNGDTSLWDFESPQAIFKTTNGFLNLTARANADWNNWWVSSPVLKNAYIEATIQMDTCNGADRFGLIVRSSSDGQRFYFMGITCDGRWGFFRMDDDVVINAINHYQESSQLTSGLKNPHRVGVWMSESDFTFYIDGVEVGNAKDSTLTESGMTGFLIAFSNTPGFTTKVDTLKYWNVP